jgi:DNA topoisomerase-2
MASKYTKLDHREHVLKRPNMYIGSTSTERTHMWTHDPDTRNIVLREMDYNPGLYKIYDEILVNALDHVERTKTTECDRVKNIRVDIDQETGYIEVGNDGDGIDVVPHPDNNNTYIPELIFGHLLTSINYDDSEDRTIGGQNGIGAKACNIFSKHFVVETIDTKTKQSYVQEFHDNMTVADTPVIRRCTKKGYTKIKFLPEYTRFGLDTLGKDMFDLMVKRVHDACAITGKTTSVYVNGTKLMCHTFERYANMYLAEDTPRVHEKLEDGWEVVVAFIPSAPKDVSFVNGICTSRGGKHVDYMAAQVVKKLNEFHARRKKANDVPIKPQHLRDNLMILLNARVVNPTFDSQTKEMLTTPFSKFGVKRPEVSERFIEKLAKTGLMDYAISTSVDVSARSLKKTDGRKQSKLRNLVKLEDANWAGTPKSRQCTLILTEGDSAMTMAMSGIDEVGRDRYGVFPLKGKLLNVKECNTQKICDNEEISNLKKIIGLESNRKYDNIDSLRYGKILILTDSDHDGSHIKGLLFNLFQSLWPSLFQMHGFLSAMLTPIIKVQKGDNKMEFYTPTEFDRWKVANNTSGWRVKYYKGLGTSTADEARDYFRKLKLVDYSYTGHETTDECMELAFNKKRADERKTWLAGYDKNDVLDHTVSCVTYEDFVNKELIHFSAYDVRRSIPSVCDGLKVSQRKIMYSCFKKAWSKECRVAQLAAFVSETSVYHHGEESLNHAIICLAQDYVGSNNINLLKPNGQFGSRLCGGKDHASPRYIYTELASLTRKVFPKADDNVLQYLEDDGVVVEPVHYMPVIPMVLVNGATGIGTGFSTSLPCYNPIDIIACLKQLLRGGTSLPHLVPWYRGFAGDIVADEHGKWWSRGKYERTGPTTVHVFELPIGSWTTEYKEVLEACIDTDVLKSYDSVYNDVKVGFVLHFTSKDVLDRYLEPQRHGSMARNRFENDLKMVSTKGLGTSNMYLFDRNETIKKYTNTEDIIQDFYGVRLEFYAKQKESRMRTLAMDKEQAQAKIIFIDEVIAGTLLIANTTKDDILQQLEDKAYPMVNGSFEYLTSMPIFSLSTDRKERLQRELDAITQEMCALESTSCEDMWMSDLHDLEHEYNSYMTIFANAIEKRSHDKVGEPKSAKRGKRAAKT